MTLRIASACFSLFFTSMLFASASPDASTPSEESAPRVLDPDSDLEYRATLEHLKQMLPKVKSTAIYVALLRPYGLLDIQPTRFGKQEDKSKFANFNLGVMGNALNLTKADVASIPSVMLCTDETCIDERKSRANEFLRKAQGGLNTLAQSGEIVVVGQLSDSLYRINNTFVSRSKAYTYSSSKVAGFIPSSNFKLYDNVNDAPNLEAYTLKTAELRTVMNEFNVAAVVRSSENTLDIIFNGAGDNQWGVVLGEQNLTVPKEGDFNQLGYQYDKISVIANNIFYYQTD